MTIHAETLLPLVVLLPLLGAFINGLFGAHMSRRAVHIIGVGSVGTAFLIAVKLFYALKGVADIDHYDPSISSTLYTWAASGSFHFDVAFYLDPLSSVMLLVVTGVGSLIHIYSMGYMSHDESYARYFSYLNLFTFSMLLLILGKNLLLLFVGWEGVGLCSYLLIGFWFTDDQKAQAGQKAFVVNRIGDFGFIIGLILLLFHAGGTTDFEVLRWHCENGAYGPFNDPNTLLMCCLLLFIGAAGKSAQIPLYIWLPDAMAGPTPVSALIHAATMVTAGVYMMCRLSYLYTLSTTAMAVVAIVGACTALFAAIIAVTQRDIKKVLAYSTISQLGYMVMAVGIGAYVAGIFHLMTHAFFKALLFLGAGSVIHGMSGEQDIFKMGGLKKKLPITRATFLIATLAIAGVPLLSGFFSKDEILWETLTRKQQLAVPTLAHAGWSDGEQLQIGGYHGVLLTHEGDSWSREQMPRAIIERRGLRSPTMANLQAVTEGPRGTGWAVADGCAVFRDDGGGWELAYQPTDSYLLKTKLHAVFAKGEKDVWFVGEHGLAIHYDGSGETPFKHVDTGVDSALRAVSATRDGTVYAAGAAGVIIQWDGSTWKRVESTGTADIIGMSLSGETLYGATSQGALLKRGEKGWEKVAVNIKGVSAINSISAISGGSGQLVLAGSVMMEGAGMSRPAVFSQTGEGWKVAVGDGTDRLRAVAASRSLVVAVDGAGTLYTVSGGKLVSAKTVPSKPGYHFWLYIVALMAAVLTAFYMFRLYLLTFEGEFRGDEHVFGNVHESPPSMTIPLIILAVLSVLGGYIGTPLFGEATNQLHHWLHPSFRIADTRLLAVHDVGEAWLYAGLSAGVAGLGIFTAWMFYAGSMKEVPERLAQRMKGLHRVMYNKFYVDELCDLIIVRPFRATASVCYRLFDVLVIDTLFVHGLATITVALGRFARLFQNGDVQQYAVFVVAGLAALIWFVGI
jgi:NADH:ubiquinone oxidoreductase subunit 5 (subunit L)/multisubunit Na+/H+ antiporter MnhA subunit